MPEILDAGLSRAAAVTLLQKYNQDRFHLQHALTVEGVMRWYARTLGHGENGDFWGLAGLLHDIDFEQYPEAHCQKAPELLRAAGASEALIHAVCSHAYGLTSDVKPEHEMEQVLFAADELTGLIGAAVLMLPSRDIADLQLKTVQKKFKDKRFAAGCSRDVIAQGADMLGWSLEKLQQDTIAAMQACDAQVRQELDAWLQNAAQNQSQN